MNLLITGANGFLGKNLLAFFRSLQTKIGIDNIYTVTRDTTHGQLEDFCEKADFVFHLAGVNREDDQRTFADNFRFTHTVLNALRKSKRICPVMFASSVQASLEGRYDSEYGRSKLLAEQAVFDYGIETGANVFVYRFPNVFGKWCKPDYNSVVATFCYHIARNEPIQNLAPDTILELLYIDDLLDEMLAVLQGVPHRKGKYCVAPVTHTITLMELERRIRYFSKITKNLNINALPDMTLNGKLLSTFLTYLPVSSFAVPLSVHSDQRGCFAQLFPKCEFGQLAINVTKPGMVKGEHWHNSKWEIFVVTSGVGRIGLRLIGTSEVTEIPVCGDLMQAVLIAPGYTHNLENLSDNLDLITLIWANESYDPDKPDTYYERVHL